VLRVGQIPSRNPVSSVISHDERMSPLPPAARAEVALHTAAIQDPSLRERFIEVISKYPSPAPRLSVGDPSRVP
jgi:hypothetical protein